MKTLFIFSLFCAINLFSFGQENALSISIGVNHSIKSTALNEERIIQVYTPENYSDSEEEYPVLYIIDGQWYFFSGVAIQKALQNPREIPEMIVVGVPNSETLRWTRLGDEKEQYADFLINEVIPFVELKYRTSKERIVFGWESAAYFISELIFEKPNNFSGAILTNGGYVSAEAVAKYDSKQTTYLYLANSKKDIYNIEWTNRFNQILEDKTTDQIIWKYELFNDEIHESLAHLALYKGLKFYYHNYNSLVFESIQQYVDKGGMNYLKNYFQERADRFGGSSEIDNGTKNSLIWLAWNRDNFEYFNIFMTEFADVLTTKRYASAYWQNRFGQFYLKHQDFQNAIKHFTIGLSNYPDSNFEKQMQEGLAQAKNMENKKAK